MLAIAISQKCRKEYECKKCDYITFNKYDYEKHINTIKHRSNVLAMESIELSQKSQEKKFICNQCNKEYKDNSGLWRHKKKECNEKNKDIISEITDNKDLILLLINDNKELRSILLEQCKEKDEYKNMVMKVLENGTHNTTTHTNSHNKAFNLNFFLNETCKDAMNIMDFVDSIKLQLTDLEKVGELGFVDGISNIIVKNLKELDITERPIHCTDKKREVLYVKDENKWEKDEEKNKIKKAIKRVANKNIRLLPSFKEKYPDCNKSTSNHSDKYNKIIVESMDTDANSENKIITKISKEVTIQKETENIS
jgi:hypothetical protein